MEFRDRPSQHNSVLMDLMQQTVTLQGCYFKTTSFEIWRPSNHYGQPNTNWKNYWIPVFTKATFKTCKFFRLKQYLPLSQYFNNLLFDISKFPWEVRSKVWTRVSPTCCRLRLGRREETRTYPNASNEETQLTPPGILRLFHGHLLGWGQRTVAPPAQFDVHRVGLLHLPLHVCHCYQEAWKTLQHRSTIPLALSHNQCRDVDAGDPGGHYYALTGCLSIPD